MSNSSNFRVTPSTESETHPSPVTRHPSRETFVRYRIAGLSVWEDEYVSLMEPLLAAATSLGHRASRIAVGRDATGDVVNILRAHRSDVCLMTGRTTYFLLSKSRGLFQALREAGVPLVILWYDNPLRYLDWIAEFWDENVILFTSIDTQCVRTMKALGFDRVEYFPIWSLTPNFRPEQPVDGLRCELSFAGGYMSRPYFETVYMPKHMRAIHRMLSDEGGEDGRQARRLIEAFITRRLETRAHVDVYEFLRPRIAGGPLTGVFRTFSVLLMNYQKILEREQLFDSVLRIPDAMLHCFGGADVVLTKTEAMKSAHERVTFHPSLDKRTEVQRVYHATAINLGLSQFPRAVHNRYFECAACGGFMIGEYKADLPALFEEGKEIVCFRDLEELPDLIRFYRGHEAERTRIGAAARRRHLAQHTPRHRMQALLPLVARALERFHDTKKVAV
jgi:spore maturation protein CgeB